MKQRRTFLQYIKDNRPWALAAITALSLLIGIPSYLNGIVFMWVFMIVVLLVTWVGSIWDWKKKG
jgi:hypothetical protein